MVRKEGHTAGIADRDVWLDPHVAELFAVRQLDRLNVQAGDVIQGILEPLAGRSSLGCGVEKRHSVVRAQARKAQHLPPPPRSAGSVEDCSGSDDLRELLRRSRLPPPGS